MTPSIFGCSFSDLADTYRLGMFEYQQYRNRFTAHKPSKYTLAYDEESSALLQAFLIMDDYQAHEKAIQAARAVYVGEVKGVDALFKLLKSFTRELSSDKTTQDNLYKDAGQQQLNDRGENNLADNDKVLGTMGRFVQSNQAALLAKDLPADFVTQVQDKQAQLAKTNKAWLDEKEAGSVASDVKTSAGNALKTRLSDLFLEAQTIFQAEKEIAEKFVWNTHLTKVRGVKDAGIGGKVTHKVTEKGVGNATISIPLLNLSIVSDATGRYELSPLPAGTYTIEVTCDGFKPQVIEGRVVKTGIIGRLAIVLEPL
jgi:flagellar motor protein MotB